MTTAPGLVLSLFSGVGILDEAFRELGYCVVSAGDVLWGKFYDIHRFTPPPHVFDGVIGGSPCQCFSRLRHLVEHNGYAVAENLIPEFERVVGAAQPRWWLMENVPAAPEPHVDGYGTFSVLLNNRWVGGEQNRLRRFTLGSISGAPLRVDVEALEPCAWSPAVLASATHPTPVRLGGSGKVKSTAAKNLGYKTGEYLKEAVRLQGLPEDFLEDAPFTVAGKIHAIGNGVPLPMGRAIARAVKAALA